MESADSTARLTLFVAGRVFVIEAPIQLIETMRVEPGHHLPLLAWHLQRLQQSCQVLGYVWPGEILSAGINEHVARLDIRVTHRLRLLLDTDGGYSLQSSKLSIIPQPLRIHLNHSPLQADPFWLQHKTTHRPWYADAQHLLDQAPDVFDIVFCNALGEICEGSRSNVYVQNAGHVWLTPPAACGLLPGVQRQALLDGGLAREARITCDDLQTARAIRISNALRGWVDAVLA